MRRYRRSCRDSGLANPHLLRNARPESGKARVAAYRIESGIAQDRAMRELPRAPFQPGERTVRVPERDVRPPNVERLERPCLGPFQAVTRRRRVTESRL